MAVFNDNYSKATRLWDASDKDAAYVLSLKFQERFDHPSYDLDGELYDVWEAFCAVYHDLFNNGGGNLTDVPYLKDAVTLLNAFCTTLPFACPPIYWVAHEAYYGPEGAEPEEVEFVHASDIDLLGRRLINHIADRLGLAVPKDERLTKHQRDVIMSLKQGGVMFWTYSGVGFSGKRNLLDKTISVVRERFGDRVQKVHVKSEKYGILTSFICLAEWIDRKVGKDVLISRNPWE